jgi:multiple sugar transport system ATP-binding protein
VHDDIHDHYALYPHLSVFAELEKEPDSEQLRTQLVVSLDPPGRGRDGERARRWLDPSRMHLFDPRTGENLTLGDAPAETGERRSTAADGGPPVHAT